MRKENRKKNSPTGGIFFEFKAFNGVLEKGGFFVRNYFGRIYLCQFNGFAKLICQISSGKVTSFFLTLRGKVMQEF